MSNDIMYGKCEICGKESGLVRTTFRYENVKCECHSLCYFQSVFHCADCTPIEPKKTKIIIKTQYLKESQQIDIQTLNTGHLIEFGMYLSGHDAETVMQIYQDWNNSL